MRKLFYMMLLACSIANAQTAPFTTANNLKITNPVEGNATDSVLVWRSIDKAVRFFPLGTKYVPYSGATRDVDLGSKRLHAGQVYIGNDEVVPTGELKDIFGIYGSSDFSTDTRSLYVAKDATGQIYITNRGAGAKATNTVFGMYAVSKNTSGTFITAFGNYSLWSNTTGISNTAFGTSSMAYNTTGNYNTAIGSSSMYSNNTGNYNTAIGFSSLNLNTLGLNNTGIGSNVLYNNLDGNRNTGVGMSSLNLNVNGSNNTAAGFQALARTTTSDNTAFGWNAGSYITTGTRNIMIGIGQNTTVGSITTGNYNTILGNVTLTGAEQTGSNQVIITDGNGSRAFEKNSTGAVDIKGTSFTFNSGGLKAGIMNITSTATVTAANIGSNGFLYIYADASAGNVTINLPAASVISGYSVWVYRKDSTANTVTIDANGSELINQSLTYSLSGQNSNAKFTSDGTQIRVFN